MFAEPGITLPVISDAVFPDRGRGTGPFARLPDNAWIKRRVLVGLSGTIWKAAAASIGKKHDIEARRLANSSAVSENFRLPNVQFTDRHALWRKFSTYCRASSR